MPLLSDLGASLDVKFTFFVNMGRAFDRRITLGKALRRLFSRGTPTALSAAGKLGLAESLHAALLNPHAGKRSAAVLRAARDAGHEIGLHGGRNHARWERDAHRWSEDELRREVRTGGRWMAECGLPAPTSFASPAWNSPSLLKKVLRAGGFEVIADGYDLTTEAVTPVDGLLSVPTNVAAGAGTAGYLETAALKRWNSAELAADWKRQLAAKQKLAVVYDHPFFAGTHARRGLGEMVRIALDQGFTVCTVSEAARRAQEENFLWPVTSQIPSGRCESCT